MFAHLGNVFLSFSQYWTSFQTDKILTLYSNAFTFRQLEVHIVDNFHTYNNTILLY